MVSMVADPEELKENFGGFPIELLRHSTVSEFVKDNVSKLLKHVALLSEESHQQELLCAIASTAFIVKNPTSEGGMKTLIANNIGYIIAWIAPLAIERSDQNRMKQFHFVWDSWIPALVGNRGQRDKIIGNSYVARQIVFSIIQINKLNI